MQNEIPNGYYAALLAFSRPWDTVGYSPRLWAKDSVSYGKNIFSVLESQGAKKVRELANYTPAPWPYGLLFRKNDPGFPALDTIVYDRDSVATIRTNFLAKWTNGQMETPAIGPAKAWKSIHWRRESFHDPSDYARLILVGIRSNGDEQALMELSGTSDTTLDFIAAAQYPQLKIRYAAGDTLKRTVPQLDYLRRAVRIHSTQATAEDSHEQRGQDDSGAGITLHALDHSFEKDRIVFVHGILHISGCTE